MNAGLAGILAGVLALVPLFALLAHLHNTRFPTLDEVLADLDREDAEKNVANETPPVTGKVNVVIRQHRAN